MITETDKILDFIKRRFSEDSSWTTGNCMWFAHILKTRFPDVDVVYDAIEGHFLVMSNGVLIDWTGIVDDGREVQLVEELIDEDPILWKRLIRDCWL